MKRILLFLFLTSNLLAQDYPRPSAHIQVDSVKLGNMYRFQAGFNVYSLKDSTMWYSTGWPDSGWVMYAPILFKDTLAVDTNYVAAQGFFLFTTKDSALYYSDGKRWKTFGADLDWAIIAGSMYSIPAGSVSVGTKKRWGKFNVADSGTIAALYIHNLKNTGTTQFSMGDSTAPEAFTISVDPVRSAVDFKSIGSGIDTTIFTLSLFNYNIGKGLSGSAPAYPIHIQTGTTSGSGVFVESSTGGSGYSTLTYLNQAFQDNNGLFNNIQNGTTGTVFRGLYNQGTSYSGGQLYGVLNYFGSVADAAAQTLYGLRNNFKLLESGDTAYGLFVGDVGSTAGTYYGAYFDLNGTYDSGYSIYVTPSSPMSFFGSKIRMKYQANDTALVVYNNIGGLGGAAGYFESAGYGVMAKSNNTYAGRFLGLNSVTVSVEGGDGLRISSDGDNIDLNAKTNLNAIDVNINGVSVFSVDTTGLVKADSAVFGGNPAVTENRTVNAGIGLNVNGAESATLGTDITLDLDATEVSDITWGDGTPTSINWTWNTTALSDPNVVIGSTFNFDRSVQVLGVNLTPENRTFAGGIGIDIDGLESADLSANRTLALDLTEISSTTWADGSPIQLTWTFDVSDGGTGDPLMKVGGGGFDFTKGLKRDGVDVVDINRAFTGGFGIDIDNSDSPQNLSVDRTISVDPSEFYNVTWGDGLTDSVRFYFDDDHTTIVPSLKVDYSGFVFSSDLYVDVGGTKYAVPHSQQTFTGGIGIDINGGSAAVPITNVSTFTFDATEINSVTWGNDGNLTIQWTYDVSGTTNPQMIVGGGGFDFTTGLKRNGVDVVDVNRSLIGGTGIDIDGGSAARNLSVDRTITFDATELNNVTWSNNSQTSLTWTWDLNTTTDPNVFIDGNGFDFNKNLSILGSPVELETHASEHQNGGNDEINVGGLSGELADPQKVAVANNGTLSSTRPRLNFIPGSNVTISISDDATNNEADITISASAGPDLSAEPFITYSASANLSAEKTLAAGNYIDVFSDATNVYVEFDPTEVNTVTWGNGVSSSITWTWNTTALSDPDVTIGSTFNFDRMVQILGTDVELDNHASEHQNGGADEINVSGLTGRIVVESSKTWDVTQNATGRDFLFVATRNLTIKTIRVFYPVAVSGSLPEWDFAFGKAGGGTYSRTWFTSQFYATSKSQYSSDVFTSFTNTTLAAGEAFVFDYDASGGVFSSGQWVVTVEFETQ